MDLDHLIGNDLQIANNGDLASVKNPTEGQQRVLRRLLTNPGDYLWHPEYGAGLAQFLGKAVSQGAIIGTIRRQMGLEEAVVQSPPPAVAVNVTKGGPVIADIRYIDRDSGLTSALTLPLTVG